MLSIHVQYQKDHVLLPDSSQIPQGCSQAQITPPKGGIFRPEQRPQGRGDEEAKTVDSLEGSSLAIGGLFCSLACLDLGCIACEGGPRGEASGGQM